jgi:diguanylate cyclase (GGDEF)-like protein
MDLKEFSEEHPFASVLLGLSLVALLGVLDWASGPTLSLEVFFLIPVALTVWFAGRKAGLLTAVLSAIAWFAADTAHNPATLVLPMSYWNVATKLGFLAAVAWLLPALKKEWEQEKSSARTDYLTKTSNKRSFETAAKIEIERAQRYNRPFSLVYLDVDKFKFVNDRYGHNTGDTLLRATAQTIQGKIRASDLVARMGGDEFALLLPETQSEAAQIVVKRIQRFLLDLAQRNEWPVTYSFGVATFLRAPESVEEMVKKVDALMYAAKNSGGNVVRHEVVGPIEVS